MTHPTLNDGVPRRKPWHGGRALLGAALAAASIGAGAQPATPRTELVIDGARTFPENITATRDGTLITGSVGSGGLYRAAPGAARATRWVAPGDNGLLDTFGVLADEASGSLWVCSSRMDPPAAGAPPEVPALYRYALASGAFRSKHPLPGGSGLCNDIAIGPDGAAYVADTTGGRLLRLPAGGQVLEEWARSAELDGADGLDFDGRQLYVNSFTTGKLLRIELKPDGAAGAPLTLATSRPLVQPDGMRRVKANQFVVAEGSGHLSLLTVKGNTVQVASLRSGLVGPAGVTVAGNTVWVLESKLSLRGKADADPAPFKAYRVPLPSR